MPKTRVELIDAVEETLNKQPHIKAFTRGTIRIMAGAVVDTVLRELDITLAPIVGETKR